MSQQGDSFKPSKSDRPGVHGAKEGLICSNSTGVDGTNIRGNDALRKQDDAGRNVGEPVGNSSSQPPLPSVREYKNDLKTGASGNSTQNDKAGKAASCSDSRAESGPRNSNNSNRSPVPESYNNPVGSVPDQYQDATSVTDNSDREDNLDDEGNRSNRNSGSSEENTQHIQHKHDKWTPPVQGAEGEGQQLVEPHVVRPKTSLPVKSAGEGQQLVEHHAVRPKTSLPVKSAGREYALASLWKEIVISLCVKYPDGDVTFNLVLKNIPIPVLQFIMIDENRVRQLCRKALGSGVQVDTADNKMNVKLTTDNEGWKTASETLIVGLEDYAKNVLAQPIVLQGNQKENIKVCHEVLSEARQEEVDIFSDVDEVIVVGLRPTADNLYRRIKEKMTAKLPPKKNINVELQDCTAEGFCQLGFDKELAAKFPLLNPRVNYVTDSIDIMASKEEVLTFMDELEEFDKKIKKKCTSFDKCITDLLKTNETKEYIYYIFEESNIKCYYRLYEDGKAAVFGLSESEIDKAENLIKESFTYVTYNVEDSIYSKALSSQEWLKVVSLNKSKKLVEFENESGVVIFGTKDVVLQICEINKHLMESQLDQSKKSPVVKTIEVPLPKSVTYLMRHNQEYATRVHELVNEVPFVTLITGEQVGVFLSINGSTDEQIQSSKKNALKIIEHSQHISVAKISSLFLEMFEKPDVVDYVERSLVSQKLFVYWVFHGVENETVLHVCAVNEHQGKSAIAKILYLLPHSNLTTPKGFEVQWLRRIEKEYNSKAIIIGVLEGADTIDVISTKDVHDCICQKITKEITTSYKKGMYARKEKIKFIEPQVKGLGDKWKGSKKSIVFKPDLGTIEICAGTPNEMKEMGEKIEEMISSTGITCILLHGNELEHLNRSRDEEQIARKNECHLKRCIKQPRPAFCFIEKDKKVNIEIICGRPIDAEVDVAVFPTNESLFPLGDMEEILRDDKELLSSAQTYISSHGKSKFGVGDMIFFDASHKYSCNKIAASVFVEKSGQNIPHNISIAVSRAIEKCQNSQVQTIAIPIQVFENQEIGCQAEAVFKGVKFAMTKNAYIKEIYLCVLDPGILDLCYKKAQECLHPNYAVFDWRPFTSTNLESPEKGERSLVRVHVKHGSLVNEKVDMLVNTVGIHLDLSQGYVSKSILAKAGSEIQTQCKARYPNGIIHGQVIETTAGKLQTCRSICHGALPEWMPRTDISIKVLKLFVWQCLVFADHRRYSSLAFPALGTGKLKYPHYCVAEAMFQVVDDFGKDRLGTSVQEISIIVHPDDQRTVKVFEAVEKKWKLASSAQAGFGQMSVPCNVKTRLPSAIGSVSVEVIPSEDFDLVEFDELLLHFNSTNTRDDFSLVENNDRIELYARKHIRMNDIMKECLFRSHDLRLTSIGIPLSGTKLKTVKEDITAITDEILWYHDNPYLQAVRIYIKERKVYDAFFKETCEDISKGSGKESTAGAIYRLVSSVLSSQKLVPAWKKVYKQTEGKQEYLVLTGKKDDVQIAQKEVKDILDKLKPQKVWFYLDEAKVKYQFDEHICKRLNVSGGFRGEHSIRMKDEENEEWQFDLKKLKCKRTNGKFEYPLKNEESMESCVDPPIQDIVPTNEASPVSNEMEPFEDVTFDFNPVLQQKPVKQQIEKIISQEGMKLNAGKFEITSSYENMMRLNDKIIKDIGTDPSIFKRNETMKSKSSTSKSNRENYAATATAQNHPAEEFTHVVAIEMSFKNYKMLKFFCPQCILFKGLNDYQNGTFSRILVPGETEDAIRQTVESKMKSFQTFNTQDVVMQDGLKIDDEKWSQVKKEVNGVAADIFCYRSKDLKTLTLASNQYEKLQTAKTKSEFILGIKSQNKGGRRHRVIATEHTYSNDTDASTSTTTRDSKPQYNRSLSSGSSQSSVIPAQSELKFTTPEGLVILVYVGNILNLKVDCIVNAANENLSHGGGVADVISRAAGNSFQQESDDYVLQHGRLGVTDCCTTSAGKLPYKCVIHAVGPRWYDYPSNKRQCASDLQLTVENCFLEAEKNNLETIAIPAISSGIFGVPKEVCCQQYCEAVINFSANNGLKTSLKEIHFMDKDSYMINIIQDEFKIRLNMTSSLVSHGTGSNSPDKTGSRVNFSGHDILKPERNSKSFSKSYSGHTSSHISEDWKTNFAGTVKEKFNKQYMTQSGLKIYIVQEDITKMAVDIIICPQDDNCLSKGRIAKAIASASNERYRNDVMGMRTVKRCEVKKLQAIPSTLPFKYVLHTVAPLWDKDAVKDNSKFMKDLALTIRNILRHCSDSKNIISAAIPVLGVGVDGHETPFDTYGQILSKEICKEAESSKLSLQELYIVGNKFGMVSSIAEIFDKENKFVKLTSFKRSRRNPGKTVEERHSSGNAPCKEIIHETDKSSSAKLGTTVIGGNVDDCVICMDTPDDPRRLKCGHVFCQNCIGQHFKLNNPKCPTCGSIHGILTGNQPPGTMTVHKRWESLEGYRECGRIDIYYHIPAGKQGPEHKTPGKYYEQIARTGYLPDNEKGRLVAKLLRVAFDRRLVFTIGDSRTTGKTGVVTWNDIHHKTNPKPYAEFGYPDPTYLDRVLEELAVKGVTKDDIKPGTSIY